MPAITFFNFAGSSSMKPTGVIPSFGFECNSLAIIWPVLPAPTMITRDASSRARRARSRLRSPMRMRSRVVAGTATDIKPSMNSTDSGMRVAESLSAWSPHAPSATLRTAATRPTTKICSNSATLAWRQSRR